MEIKKDTSTDSTGITQYFSPPNLANIVDKPKHKSSNASKRGSLQEKTSVYGPNEVITTITSPNETLTIITPNNNLNDKKTLNDSPQSSNDSLEEYWREEHNAFCLQYMQRCLESWKMRLYAAKKMQRIFSILKGVNILSSSIVAILGAIFGIEAAYYTCSGIPSTSVTAGQIILAIASLIVGFTSGWLAYYDYQKKITSEKNALKKVMDLFNKIESCLYKLPKYRPSPSQFLNDIVKDWSEYQDKGDVLQDSVYKWKLRVANVHTQADEAAKKNILPNVPSRSYFEEYGNAINDMTKKKMDHMVIEDLTPYIARKTSKKDVLKNSLPTNLGNLDSV